MVIQIQKKLIFGFFFAISVIHIFSESSFAASGQFKIKSVQNDIQSGQTSTVEIYVSSDTPINAAEIHLSYPSGIFDIIVDSNGSAFGIKVPETINSNSLIISKGNITPLNGENLFAKLNVKAIQNAQLSQIQAVTGTQILTSSGNQNIYASTFMDIPGVSNPNTNPPATTATPTPSKNENSKNIIFRAIKEFFRKLFRF